MVENEPKLRPRLKPFPPFRLQPREFAMKLFEDSLHPLENGLHSTFLHCADAIARPIMHGFHHLWDDLWSSVVAHGIHSSDEQFDLICWQDTDGDIRQP